jgi:flavin-dependent dehydrogenase
MKNRTSEMFDVLVVGGGPAGAAVALCLARQGCKVALLEATAYESQRYGETLPPEINPVLRELGVWDAFRNLSPLEAPGMISVWGDPIPVESDFIRNVHGLGWHIDRASFDRMLVLEAEKAGAQLHLRRRVNTCSREGDCWRVNGLRARILVDASGRNGIRLDGNGDRDTDDELLAIALSVSRTRRNGEDLRTCIESTPSGWWYTAPLPNGSAIAMLFTDPAIYRQDGISIQQQLSNAPITGRRLKGGQIDNSRVLHVTSSCRRAVFGAGWLAVGDSACSFEPISGRGIFNALRRASFASTAIIEQLGGNPDLTIEYAWQLRLEYDEYVRQRWLYYTSERRWSNHLFWRSRRASLHAYSV